MYFFGVNSSRGGEGGGLLFGSWSRPGITKYAKSRGGIGGAATGVAAAPVQSVARYKHIMVTFRHRVFICVHIRQVLSLQ